ncbi:MAG TPA: hypothetical protein VKU61_01080, partial [Candidatus Binatia bacterium]|nr:hypothetical protein [Candidatus Binatia bacterium]
MRAAVAMLLVALAPLAARGSATVVVRAGDPSPFGLPFSQFSDAALDDHGRIAFVGGSTALFRLTPSGPVRLVAAGDTLLNQPIAGVSSAALSSACVAFRVLFVGGGVAIARQCGSSTTFVAEVGSLAPNGERFAGFTGDVAVGAGGRVAFVGVLEDGTSVLVLVEADGTLHEITHTTAQSPAGGTLSSLRLIGIAASGRVGFRAAVSSGPDGLFYGDETSIRKIAVAGDASPTGGAFTSVSFAAVNDAETWTFRGQFADGRENGVFRVSTAGTFASPITAVAVTGDATPVGGTYGDFPNSIIPAINSSGTIAFRAVVKGGPDHVSAGVFVAPPGGAIEGPVVVGRPSPIGNLARLRSVAIADDGGVVFRASLEGSPGVFRAFGGQVDRLAMLEDATDLGRGFRYTDAFAADSSDTPILLGVREGVFITAGGGSLETVAKLDERTPLKGRWAGFDQPDAGGGRIVFGGSVESGHAGEGLFAIGPRGRPTIVAASGRRVAKSITAIDFFSSPIDELARPGVLGPWVAFQTALGGGLGTGIVFTGGAGLRMLVHQGQKAPGGGTYAQFGTPTVARGGHVVFVATDSAGSGVYETGAGGGRSANVIAASGNETGTRLGGCSGGSSGCVFRAFDTPSAGPAGIAFHATLEQSHEGVFLIRGGCIMALAGTGDVDPAGAKLRTFAGVGVAGDTVVFRAIVVDGAGG